MHNAIIRFVSGRVRVK